MLPLLFLIATAGLIEARPSVSMLRPTFGMTGVVGGVDASPGEFPWQLSQQRSNSHSCGASLISATRALSAAHCVDGAAVGTLRVIAGLHQRSNTAGTQISNLASYTMHEQYNQGTPTFANDIAILNLATAIQPNGGSIQFATLASASSGDYAGTTCVISGWGRTSSSNVLPDTLQKASIGVISNSDCQSRVQGIGNIGGGHICLFDSATPPRIGSCNGDSGGPLNCDRVVAGVTSWGISSLGSCRQDYPSVYTRVSFYAAWISSHM